MPCWFAIFVNAFCNETVAFCCENVLYLREKNLHASLKVWKKHSLLTDFSKFSKIMCHDGFLIMQIMRPEPKKMWLAKKAKFNTSYLITSWILRCNWIRCIKPTLLFPSVKHNVLNYVGHFCFHYYMYMYNNVIITAVISFIRWCQASSGEDSDGLD